MTPLRLFVLWLAFAPTVIAGLTGGAALGRRRLERSDPQRVALVELERLFEMSSYDGGGRAA